MKEYLEVEHPKSVCELLRQRAAEQPARRAYTFLVDGESEEIVLTHEALERQSLAIAAKLERIGAVGERAVLLYPDGPEFIPAFFGCLRAGTLAVPTFPPHPARLDRTLPRLHGIVADAGARVLLTTQSIIAMKELLLEHAPALGELTWIATDAVEAAGGHVRDRWRHAAPDDLAYLQYTSGSTSSPKGVRVTHRNLLHNLEMMRHGFHMSADKLVLGWLPLFHDMGLIGNVLGSLYFGSQCVLMSPLAFLQHPIRWLRAISRYRAVASGGPSFAYDLCARKITRDDAADLDLTSWRIAFCGAEPIHQDTLDRFASAFSCAGFRAESFIPCYGLAEATLLVSAGHTTPEPSLYAADARALEHRELADATPASGTSRMIVGCGRILPGETVRIVDPERRTECPANHVGEIWVASPSVADGYWNNPEESTATFGALLQNGEGPFLRTGDLGFVKEGELFVTGRCKDLIIVRGRNHHPQDIERSVQHSHPALRPGCGAAFSVDSEGEERLVVVQEVVNEHDLELEVIIDAIRQAVTRGHDLQVYTVALVAPRTVPKTSSGKLQRRACRDAFIRGELAIVAEWCDATVSVDVRTAQREQAPERQSADAAAIERWLAAALATALRLDAAEIDPCRSFSTYGLDSAQAVSLAGDLETWLGRPVAATVTWEHPTIRSLAEYLAGETKQTATPTLRGDAIGTAEPIAVVGIGCRFPGASGADDFWRLLCDGVDAIAEAVPQQRQRLFGGSAWLSSADDATGRGGFIADVDQFDADFFRITPQEAAAMDPQQRLLLEVACEALEDAWLPHERMRDRRAGVFVGISGGEYASLQLAAGRVGAYFGPGSALSIAANRISYTLGLRGPSIAVDTACSSSLVAVHMACRSLRDGDCEVALVGGANLLLRPEVSRSLAAAGALAKDGRCKTFDARADGYVRGEGAGVVVLKPLSTAVADGDRVYAVIRGSGVNNDGASNGLTAPNPRAQEDVLRTAYRDAGVDPAEVDYIEAHGTGTRLGDPIEAHALGAVVGAGRPPQTRCLIGSVKSNIGHLEAGAGIAGLIKVALALSHRAIPASLHFETPNPLIAFDALGLEVQSALKPWPERRWPPRAGISSFGFGGTNAHVVLEAAAEAGQTTQQRSPRGEPVVREHLITLSARSDAALRAEVQAVRDWVRSDAPSVADIAYTAAVRRSHHEHAVAFVARTGEELAAEAEAFLTNGVVAGPGRRTKRKAPRPKRAFVFSGQGSQWPQMGLQLLKQEAAVREMMERCDALTRRYAGWSLIEEITQPREACRLCDTEVAQPVIFAVQVALGRLWRAWGIEPDAVVGHSLGEIAAACDSGALSLEEAMRIVVLRARLTQQAAGLGRMVAVDLSPGEVAGGLNGEVAIAVINSPTSVVIAGPVASLEAAVARLEARGVSCRPVPQMNYPSHTPHMEIYGRALEAALGPVETRETVTPMVSTVTGQTISGHALTAAYWGTNLRRPVLFADAVAALRAQGVETFIELGGHPVLLRPIIECYGAADSGLLTVGSVRRDCSERQALLEAAGALYVAGETLNWPALCPDGRPVRFPTYPWQHQSFWVTPAGRTRHVDDHPLGWRRIDSPAFPGSVFQGELGPDQPSGLEAYPHEQTPLVSLERQLAFVLAAARQHFGRDRIILVERLSACELTGIDDGERVEIQVVLQPESAGSATVEIFARPMRADDTRGDWTTSARGSIRLAEETVSATGLDLRQLAADFPRGTPPEGFPLHPAVLEQCVTGLAAFLRNGASGQDRFLLAGIDRLRLAGDPPRTGLSCAARLRESTETIAVGDVHINDAAGKAWIAIEGMKLERVAPAELERRLRSGWRDWLYALDWRKRPAEAAGPLRQQVGRWLVLQDEGGVGAELATAIEAAGGTCDRVSVAHGSWVADAMARLREEPFDGVVHLGSLDVPETADALRSEVEGTQQCGCGSVVQLVQALAAEGDENPPRLWVVTRGAQRVTGDQRGCAITQAALWGLGRAIALEHPELWGGLVDLEPREQTRGDIPALVALLTAGKGEDHVAFRNGERYVARLVRQRVTGAAGRPLPLRADGTYLITGGLGGFGLRCAHWLVARGARHLVLVGSGGADGATAAAVLDDLAQRGAEVRALRADVADADAVERVFETLAREMPPLAGVIHAAPLWDDVSGGEQDPSRFADVFAARATGAWNLHRLTRECSLDFFVLFSSVSTFAGWGLQNHAAATSCVDAVAQHRRALGLPALSLNWGLWTEDAPAAGPKESYRERLQSFGIGTFAPDEGIAVLEELVQRDVTQVVVAPIDWRTHLRLYPGAAPAWLGELAAEVGEAGATRGAELLERILRLPEKQREGALLEHVRATIAAVFGLGDATAVDPDQSLADMGFDSLTALQLRHLLQTSLGIAVSVPQLLGMGSPAGIANMLLEGPDGGGGAYTDVRTAADMRKEVVLDASIRLPSGLPLTAASPQRVLLTGATGFLGPFLLADVLRHTSARAYCLVRADSPAAGLERLARGLKSRGVWDASMIERIVPVIGDLTKPGLGLAAAEASTLAREIDAIYHNGANVNFVLPYSHLKPTNVIGTQEVLRFAVEGRLKPVHHVSTVGVFHGFSGGDVVREDETLDRSDGLPSGYAQSKWVAEELVREANRRGVPATIYRLAVIAGHSVTGATNTSDLFFGMLVGCIQLGAAPDLAFGIDLAPVDYVARAFVHIASTTEPCGEAYHLVSPRPAPVREIAEWIRELGYPLQLVSYPAWRTMLGSVKVPELNALTPYLSLLPEADEPPIFHLPRFDCERTLRALESSTVRCPPAGPELLGTYLRYLAAQGIIDAAPCFLKGRRDDWADGCPAQDVKGSPGSHVEHEPRSASRPDPFSRD